MSAVVTIELPDDALAADVAAGLAQVEEGLREAAKASTTCWPRRPAT